MKCIFCNTIITEKNKTEEHIIPQSIGGILTLNNVCWNCNNEFGNSIDRVLFENVALPSIVFNVYRERKSNKKIQINSLKEGDPYILNQGGKIKIASDILKTNNNQLKISYTDKNDLQTKINKLNKRRTENKIHISDQLEEFNRDTRFLHKFTTGDADVMRAIAKIGFEYYLESEGIDSFVNHLIPYIQGTYNASIVFPDYNEPPDSDYFKRSEICHSLEINSDNVSKKLICKVSLFSTWKYIIFLNLNYVGENVYSIFKQNLDGKILEKQTLMKGSPKIKENLWDQSIQITEKNINILGAYVSRYQKAFFYETIKHNIGKELEVDYLGYPQGTIITDEIAIDLSKKSFKEIFYEIE
ncbi:HNH endonuclease [Leptospira vanthielii]|uniref:HNH endonuclease n=1 Tax=Leptospira vanthielii serovar Holland str. Waz Holland = ATCC 700522 TaxID=1218591 RepID=N1W3G4_9LEPT|nr:HNH endonuclease [Leptospira vanthielii]EMY67767.1 HNH endonuclease [Leptospira vanthielii serovar Holland str. Waz Holland = ATCC 700522]